AIAADLAGGVNVVSLKTGTQLYHYQTGGYVTASPAVSDNDILVSSSDGFLYDFAPGGGNETTLPKTVITSPADSSTVANPNGSLTVTGTASDGLGVGGVGVAIEESGPTGQWWDAATSSWVSGPVDNPATVSATGSKSTTWTFSYPVPRAGSTFEVAAYTTSTGGQSDIKGSHSGFDVQASTSGPMVTAASGFAVPGMTVDLSGSGFTASETVSATMLGAIVGTATTTGTGTFSGLVVKVPPSELPGVTAVVVSDTSGKSSSVGIDVTNDWLGFAHDTQHTGFEGNDSALFNLVHPGGNIFMNESWHYNVGHPIETSPAIYDGVLYIADTAGHLYAFDSHNGVLLWTWTSPNGVAIDGSPYVDTERNQIIVGSSDGVVYAVADAGSKKGTTLWSKSVGSKIYSPIELLGTVYVTAADGHVVAINASSGNQRWNVPLGSPVSSAPVLDPAGDATSTGALVIGETSGTVVALNPATGAQLWAPVTLSGGSITASGSIFGGVIYIGAGNDVYALSEATGAQSWVQTLGGAVNCTGAITNSITPGGDTELIIGDGDGKMYALDTATGGTVNFTTNFGSSVVGVAAVKGVAAVETAKGYVGTARSYTDLDTWRFHTAANLDTAPAIINGAVFVGGEDGNVYAFTSYGQPPA
ncbi:MAG TPA: PQQ-binding-like beta-propeller repeat protein, partial [Acidimicrobiales bacterium]|nr:PQQ-binding-like beta-propeller repeat protein [Acidimicrobiales bacterium]